MMAQEWPIAASAVEGNHDGRAPAHSRLATVRADFFLNPAERLTEHERALMTTMLHCLVADIAAEIRAALPPGWEGAELEDGAIVDKLIRSGLVDNAELIALLLRRADEERIASAARARSGRSSARALQGLISHDNGSVSAAAMALILVRGRRRDRFGQCLIASDDLSDCAAEQLTHAIAAVLRPDRASAAENRSADLELAAAAAELIENRQPSRGMDALIRALVALLDEADALTPELLVACAEEGEVAFLGEVLGRRAGILPQIALDELFSSNAARIMMLMRIAGFSRDLAAAVLASIGDLLGIGDAGDALGLFDRISADQVKAAAAWLSTPRAYRCALDALGAANG
jgi:hypothetical protein